MKKEFRKQFISNLKEIKNKDIADDVEHILELIETAKDESSIPGIKKLHGYKDFYRIRIDDYRIGVKIAGKTIIFVCLYHRSVMYKQFP